VVGQEAAVRDSIAMLIKVACYPLIWIKAGRDLAACGHCGGADYNTLTPRPRACRSGSPINDGQPYIRRLPAPRQSAFSQARLIERFLAPPEPQATSA
jgi:hypothetical protein